MFTWNFVTESLLECASLVHEFINLSLLFSENYVVGCPLCLVDFIAAEHLVDFICECVLTGDVMLMLVHEVFLHGITPCFHSSLALQDVCMDSICLLPHRSYLVLQGRRITVV